jgi:tripartite-type tricarboxylate transporter receptor subunit TctC
VPADGYTLLQLNVANAINTALYEKLNFNLLNDIVPVASFMRVPNVMEVTLSLPVKTVPEFIAYHPSHHCWRIYTCAGDVPRVKA